MDPGPNHIMADKRCESERTIGVHLMPKKLDSIPVPILQEINALYPKTADRSPIQTEYVKKSFRFGYSKIYTYMYNFQIK